MYSIDELEKTFLLHHEKHVEMNKNQIEEFKKNNPDLPLPEYMLEDFSFPAALAAICTAIRDLREFVKPK
jgi:hypothetical protein